MNNIFKNCTFRYFRLLIYVVPKLLEDLFFSMLAQSYTPKTYTQPYTVSSQPSQCSSVPSRAYTHLSNKSIEKERHLPSYAAANREPGFLPKPWLLGIQNEKKQTDSLFCSNHAPTSVYLEAFMAACECGGIDCYLLGHWWLPACSWSPCTCPGIHLPG